MSEVVCGKALLICLPASLLTGASCVYVSGCGPMAQYEKQVSVSASLASGQRFSAETRDGSITIEGDDTADCSMVATIRTHARTAGQAEGLAEQIQVRLQPSGAGLQVVIERPALVRNAGYGASLDVRLPMQTDLTLATRDGSITLSGATGQTCTLHTSDGDLELNGSHGTISVHHATFGRCEANTSGGTVHAGRLEGESLKLASASGTVNLINARADAMELWTSNGPVKAHDVITGNLKAGPASGSVTVTSGPSSPTDLKARITSGYGNISLTAPPEFAGAVCLATGYGSVRTDLAMSASGSVSKKKLTGTVGQGEGDL